MTNELSSDISNEQKQISYGLRLKNAREALGLERKQVANHLRLNEKIIVMMERERYPADLPIMFIRGYLRAYGLFLQIPEAEITKAIQHIKPKASAPAPIPTIKPLPTINQNDNYFLKILTYFTVFIFIFLAGVWYYDGKPHILFMKKIAANHSEEKTVSDDTEKHGIQALTNDILKRISQNFTANKWTTKDDDTVSG